MSNLRLIVLATCLGAVPSAAEDITIRLHDGAIVLVDPQFIRVNEFGVFVPELSFRMRNETSTSWQAIELQVDIGGICKTDVRQWQVVLITSLGWMQDGQFTKDYRNNIARLYDEVEGCRTEIIKAALVSAENPQVHVGNPPPDRVDLKGQLQAIKAKLDAEEAERQRIAAEEKAKAAEEKAKKDAAEAARERICNGSQSSPAPFSRYFPLCFSRCCLTT